MGWGCFFRSILRRKSIEKFQDTGNKKQTRYKKQIAKKKYKKQETNDKEKFQETNNKEIKIWKIKPVLKFSVWDLICQQRSV